MPIQQITTGIIADGAVVATDIANGTVTGPKLGANSVSSNNIVSVLGSAITANTVANSAFQTGSVENYLNAGGRPLSNRNLIFNGAMQIAQRNTSVTGITTNDSILTADRWKITSGSLGTWTMNVVNDGPTSTGLTKSSNLICTTAQTSPPSGSYLLFKQDMEGQMLQSIKKGTPGAEQVTVSFWVKSSNTGTFIAEMRDNDNSRACSRSFTINSANTWEKETITFPADTTGQLDNDNARSMELAFWFGAGSEYSGGTLQTTWGASAGADNTRAAGQLNLANRAGNYIAFTGIQWEIGPVATPFEFEDVGTTLSKCQRYFINERIQGYGLSGFCDTTTTAIFYLTFRQTMRGDPSLTALGTWEVRRSGVNASSATIGGPQVTPDGARVNVTSSSLTAGQGVGLTAGSGIAYLQFSAEL